MNDAGKLRAAILARMIDPETGVDVVRLRLNEEPFDDTGYAGPGRCFPRRHRAAAGQILRQGHPARPPSHARGAYGPAKRAGQRPSTEIAESARVMCQTAAFLDVRPPSVEVQGWQPTPECTGGQQCRK